jgi:hypothetical protein
VLSRIDFPLIGAIIARMAGRFIVRASLLRRNLVILTRAGDDGSSVLIGPLENFGNGGVKRDR